MIETRIMAYMVPVLARYKRVYACSCNFSMVPLPKLPPRKVEIRESGSAYIPLDTYDVGELVKKYKINERTAYRWIRKGARPGFLRSPSMPKGINVDRIARLSAWRVGKNLRDKYALDEFAQEARIAMWEAAAKIDLADDPEAFAFTVGLQAARVAYRGWRYDRLGITNLPTETKKDIVNRSRYYDENPPDEEEME